MNNSPPHNPSSPNALQDLEKKDPVEVLMRQNLGLNEKQVEVEDFILIRDPEFLITIHELISSPHSGLPL